MKMTLRKIFQDALVELRQLEEPRGHHVLWRAKERYDLDLTLRDLRDAADRIDRGQGLLSRNRADEHPVYFIKIHGTVCRVVYSPITRRLVTFLPRSRTSKGACE